VERAPEVLTLTPLRYQDWAAAVASLVARTHNYMSICTSLMQRALLQRKRALRVLSSYPLSLFLITQTDTNPPPPSGTRTGLQLSFFFFSFVSLLLFIY